ncbi:proteasome subunit beta type-7-like [Schistocerca gregaria]|uniref:proteasome subunit beta type-7-like n=1 Tax=Schistocerca gregaria TaxID=7010 RepID=UPI00211F235C|nr:proteasome subunit beta type-7-like [Schistocerca gregaria]
MASAEMMEYEGQGGFSFENCRRNNMLYAAGVKPPSSLKTGTTIVGCVFKDGVILGADTRATEGPIVAEKNTDKIHYISKRIYCCGAGTAADTSNTTELISSQLELHRLATKRAPRVRTALTMLKQMLFKYQGYISAALVLGGVDCDGPSLFSVYPHGSGDELPFATMGSGSLAAVSVFESRYKRGMSKEEAMKLVIDAVSAGIFEDLGSGSNVDLVVIEPSKTEVLRNYRMLNPKKIQPSLTSYRFSAGTTPVLRSKVLPLKRIATVESEVTEERHAAMEVS